MNLKPFCQIPKDFMSSSGFVSKTEDETVVELTASSKIIFAYMLDKTEFFVKDLKSEHFETQATIAEACGVEVKSVTRAMALFVHHGAIRADLIRKLHISPHLQWYYREVVTDIELTKRVKGKAKQHVSMDSGVVYTKIAAKTLPARKELPKQVAEVVPEYSDQDLVGIAFDEQQDEDNFDMSEVW